MFTTLINDCRDPNAFGRQATKTAALIDAPVNLVGVNSDLEAAGNLVDVLSSAEGRKGVILVNVAPRHGTAKKWLNGTPFGWFSHGDTLVVTSIDGLTLSLVKKLGLVKEIQVFDIPTVMDTAIAQGLISEKTAEYVKITQFRSLEFMPRVVAWLVAGHDLPSEPLNSNDIPDAPPAVWYVDCFGNCKTTLLQEETGRISHPELATIPHHARLKDVPDGATAIIIGSSGHDERHFLEIVVQGGNASERLGLMSGSIL